MRFFFRSSMVIGEAGYISLEFQKEGQAAGTGMEWMQTVTVVVTTTYFFVKTKMK